MGTLVLALILMYVVTIGSFIGGEYLARKKPNSKFSKWWRKRVVSDDDIDDNNDRFIYM
jgi:hypothetical protein